MVASTWLRAAHRGVPTFLVTALLLGQSSMALAQSPAQRQELVAALRQLDALERTVADSAAHTPVQPGERYHSITRGCWLTWRACALASRPISLRRAPSRATFPNWPATYRTERAVRAIAATTAEGSHERRPGLGISSQQRHRAFRDGDRPGRRRVRGLLVWGVWAIRTAYVGWCPRAASTSASSSASASASSRCTSS